MKNNIVIGDVHGCFKTLSHLISLFPTDNIFLLGDLVDKGPDSCSVIELCINKGFSVVKGNHEIFFSIFGRKYLNGEDISSSDWFFRYGGNRTIQSYQGKEHLLEKHLSYIDSLPFKIFLEKEVDRKRLFLTHGFSLPYIYDIDNNKAFTSNRVYGKHLNINNVIDLDFPYLNVFGHDPFNEPLIVPNKIYGIDTGCCYGNKLSSFCFETKEIISIDCLDNPDYSDAELNKDD